MAKHTPGPWHIFGTEPDDFFIEMEVDEFPGIECSNPRFSVIEFGEDEDSSGVKGRTPEETLANAKLIAAAPELLDILEAYLSMHINQMEQFNLMGLIKIDPEQDVLVIAARAVIKKATE